MMKINLLRCFPHRFTKHYDRKSGKTFSICLRCMKQFVVEADYRTPTQKWYEFIDRIADSLRHGNDDCGGPSLC